MVEQNEVKPLITVMVLSYNNFSYYEQCFSSILNQTYNNIEIIISDDASKEFDGKLMNEYIKKHNKGNVKNIIINRNEKNIGIVKNYNKAIKLGNGEYFFYLAIDDVFYDENVLSDVVDFFEKSGYLIFTGYKDVYDESMEKYIKTLPRENEVEFFINDAPRELYEKLCKGSFISGSNTPFSKKLVEKYGYLDEKYFYLEDYPKYLKLTREGCSIGFYDRKLIKYRMGGVTTNGVISELLRKDLRITTLDECGDYFRDKWNDINFRGKKIIGWGTGDCCVNSLSMLIKKPDYLVDSNSSIQGQYIEGIKVCSPEELLKETKSEVYVLVFSYANYFDISKCLDEYGFKEEENYFCCTPNILDVIGEDVE